MGGYLATRHRMLLDMHIPDWDPGFLARFDPLALAEHYVTAGAEAVMVYAKSHLGLCYWPTTVGRTHAALRPGGALAGRDLLGELVTALRERGILVCGYHSVAFDNDVAEHYPQWRVQPARTSDGRPFAFIGPRYGTLCLNEPEYLAYERAQLADLLSRYTFDAFFTDMVFWGGPCACDRCRTRFAAETGLPFPTRLDWTSPEWAAFARVRQRWSREAWEQIHAEIRKHLPDAPVYHNFAAALGGWLPGVGLDGFALDTFVGGDMYGDRYEQLLVCKLMRTVTRHRPPEYMTSATPALRDHVGLKSQPRLLRQVLAATALDCAFLLIDAVDPDGSVNPGLYERAGRVFAAAAPLRPYLGGRPLTEIGVFYSPAARIDLDEDPVALAAPPRHLRAALGACRALQRAHLPFDVLTPEQRDDLARWPVIVIPDATRLDEADVRALRTYVAGGGRLYASGGTSLADLDGRRFTDFALVDVFGVHADGVEPGDVIYLTPTSPALVEAIAPQRHVTHQARSDTRLRLLGTPTPRLRPDAEGTALATLTLPYAYPEPGTLSDHRFASIHSSPPWESTELPVIVEHQYGSGRSIYSAAPLEAAESGAAVALFVALIRDLLGEPPAVTADAPADVWIEAFDQPDRSRVVVSLLHYPAGDDEAPAVSARIVVRPQPDTSWRGVTRAPDGRALAWRARPDGSAEVEVTDIDPFAMVVLAYERTGPRRMP